MEDGLQEAEIRSMAVNDNLERHHSPFTCTTTILIVGSIRVLAYSHVAPIK